MSRFEGWVGDKFLIVQGKLFLAGNKLSFSISKMLLKIKPDQSGTYYIFVLMYKL